MKPEMIGSRLISRMLAVSRACGGRAVLRIVALALALSVSFAAPEATPRQAAPRDCRLIINWDQMNMWALQLTYAHRGKTPEPAAVKTMLEQIVDEHAKARIDRIVHCLFALPSGSVPLGLRSFARKNYMGAMYENTESGMRHLEEAGYDFVKLLLDRSHQKGMEFLGGLRMNDRHGDAAKLEFGLAHPEWLLTESLAMDLRSVRGRPRTGPEHTAMDYKHEGVRKTVLAVAAELLERYDLDGLELDWMRHCHVFNPSEAAANAPILTGFMAEMRKLVDQAAARRGRGKLQLGVRIPQTLEECRALGYDVGAWIRNGSVDFICPSDFFSTDMNIRIEDFVALTRGTDCKVYPSVHPKITNSKLGQVHSAASYRAAARNYYAYGADGISSYNHQYHWRADMGPESDWPRAMSYLTSARDNGEVARGDRHYMYYPLWPRGGNPTGPQFDKYDVIELSRGGGAPSGSLRFRMAEDLRDPRLSARFEFKIGNLVEADQLKVWINQHHIPAERIERTHFPARPAPKELDSLPAGYLYSFEIPPEAARSGDNELRLQLTKSAGANRGEKLVAKEFEIHVKLK